MHPQSPPLTIGGTVVKESDDLVILGVTFDSKITFEKHLRSVSRAASQRDERKSWRAFHDRSLLGRSFRGFGVLFCSLVTGCRYNLKLLDRAVSGARFLTGGVIEGDISHRRSVAVLCMLYKIRCNPVHTLNGAQPGQYVPVRVTSGALVAHRYTDAPARCRTLQYSRTFVPFSVSLWNDLANPVFDGVGLSGFKSRANACLFIGLSCSIPTIVFYSFFLSLLSVYSWYCGAGSSD